jgi:hypothetical protein
MRLRRRVRLIAVAATLIAAAAVSIVLLADRSKVTRANYDRVAVGMSLTEVEALFGEPGRPFHGYPGRNSIAYYWENDNGSFAIVFFDEDKKVLERARWEDSTQTVFDRIRRLIRRAARK